MGEMSLNDFDSELCARGFDSLTADQRKRYLNWGYRRIARKARWTWEQTSAVFTVAAGDTIQVSTGPGVTGIPGVNLIGSFKSLTKAFLREPFSAKLNPVSDDELERWLAMDLTDSSNWGTPSKYALWNKKFYLLPPPDSSVDVEVFWKQQVNPLANPSDVPITPPDLDEAILLAALVRAHKRVNEIALSQSAAADLQEIFEDMANDESFAEEEQLTRVSPDDTWF